MWPFTGDGAPQRPPSLFFFCVSAVKCLWPVGGALMQCFKSKEPCGKESRERRKRLGEHDATGTDAPQKTPWSTVWVPGISGQETDAHFPPLNDFFSYFQSPKQFHARVSQALKFRLF